ncbi:sorcin-like [Asterias rubens]|uniref:sorcin-like n=1 Tax=Asterias rubens TaxID=7604 RepID=UPI001455593D|nr:sorcin-like [Asterias rubens]
MFSSLTNKVQQHTYSYRIPRGSMNIKVVIILLVLPSICLGQNAPDPLYGYFAEVAGQDGQISVNELQRALTASGIIGSYRVFSRATCAILISVLDRDYSGKMGLNEFQEMWTALNQWKESFARFDSDRSGEIEAHELQSALSAFGYDLSPQAQGVIFKRFSEDGNMPFDDYVFCLVKLRAITDHFRRRDASQNGYATFKYDDFIQVTMIY